MGCFQSIPKSKKAAKRSSATASNYKNANVSNETEHEFFDCRDAKELSGDLGNGNVVQAENKFFDASESILSGDAVSSGAANLGDSAIAEHASSNSSSEGCSDRPSSPELAVSPNPLSPQQTKPPVPLIPVNANAGRIVKTSTPSPPLVLEQEVPRNDPRVRSRLGELSAVRARYLALQVFFQWRLDVLRAKYDETLAKLSEAGSASSVILSENTRLKTRLSELENAIAIVESVPKQSVSTSTSDLFPSSSSTPLIEEFMTPPSRPVDIPEEFLTPDSAPRYEPKRNWESYSRPTSITQKTPPSSTTDRKDPTARKEKLKAITEDLFKLSESLAVVDLKRRKVVGS